MRGEQRAAAGLGVPAAALRLFELREVPPDGALSPAVNRVAFAVADSRETAPRPSLRGDAMLRLVSQAVPRLHDWSPVACSSTLLIVCAMCKAPMCILVKSVQFL